MCYAVDPNRVSHERLQDEVIIISMETGAYYSGSGTAADVWTLISKGTSIERAVAILAGAYAGDETVIRKDVETCVSFLLDRKIVHEVGDATGGTVDVLGDVSGSWTTPAFDEYTDMWDLIQLDPIHDVDEAGWPFGPPRAGA